MTGSYKYIFGVGRDSRRHFMQLRRGADYTSIRAQSSHVVRSACAPAILDFKPWSAAVLFSPFICAIALQCFLYLVRKALKHIGHIVPLSRKAAGPSNIHGLEADDFHVINARPAAGE
jgi:hypothetical protein